MSGNALPQWAQNSTIVPFNNEVNIKLKDGELICDKCKGRGAIIDNNTLSGLTYICPKCQGDGKVDWISHITGKPQRDYYGTSSSGLISSSTYMYAKTGTSGYPTWSGIVAKPGQPSLSGNLATSDSLSTSSQPVRRISKNSNLTKNSKNSLYTEKAAKEYMNIKLKNSKSKKIFNIRKKISQWIDMQRDVRRGTFNGEE